MNILGAISKGFSAKTILSHISQAFPKYAKGIAVASAAGYSPQSILKKLTKGNGYDSDDEYLTEHEKGRKANKQSDIKALMQLGKGVATAGLGAFALSRLGGSAANAAINGAQGFSGQTINVPPGSPSPSNLPSPSQAISQSQNLASAANAATPNTLSPIANPREELKEKLLSATEEDQTPVPPNTQIVKKIDDEFPELITTAKRSLASGNSPEKTYEKLQKSAFYSGLVDKYEMETGQKFLDRLNSLTESEGVVPTEKKGISKQSSVITPFGVGDVDDIVGDNAVVSVNGKKRKIPLSEVEEPSLDAIEEVTRILDIPEDDRSSNVALFMYDPEDSQLFVQFHSGDFWKYKDMPFDIVKELADKNATPITEGKNIYGEWSPNDKKSLGAALYQYVINNPTWKKSSKGEPANPNYKKLSPLYDYWEKLRKKPKRKS